MEATIIGNLTRDPELKFIASGQALCSFSVAENRRWKGKDDAWQEHTNYWNCTAWAELAENIAQSLQKGARIIVQGRVDQREYETNEGEKRTVFEMTVNAAGPELRFATAIVDKVEREQVSEPAPRAPKTAPPKRVTGPADEEPF